jgi:recombination protein RecA
VITGARTRIKVAKNKVGIPFREAEVDLIYGQGFSRETDILDMAADRGIVDKAGAWYSYNGDRIGQGRERVREYLMSKPEVADEIEAAIREKELAE